jgi:hypothetical protein
MAGERPVLRDPAPQAPDPWLGGEACLRTSASSANEDRPFGPGGLSCRKRSARSWACGARDGRRMDRPRRPRPGARRSAFSVDSGEKERSRFVGGCSGAARQDAIRLRLWSDNLTPSTCGYRTKPLR